MSKKGIIFSILIASAAVISGKILIDKYDIRMDDKSQESKNPEEVQASEETITADESKELIAKEAKKPKIQISDLHSDILRLIASGEDNVCNISPAEAEKELENRTGYEVEADNQPINIKDLPFEILRAIAKAPASIAGIKPQTATKEIIRRYLALDGIDSDDVNSTILLEALQRRQENKVINKWADNEDAEAIDKFLKEEADNNESSVANFVYGLRRLNDEPKTATAYMERYANHPQSDAFDNPDEEAAEKELIKAVKKLNHT